MPVTLTFEGRAYSTELFGLRSDTTLHGFTLADGTPTTLSDKGVLIARGIHDRLGVGAGNQVTVTMPDTPPVVATVAGVLDERIGSYAYAPISWIQNVTGHPVKASSALLRLDSHADRDAIRRAARDRPDVAFFEDFAALRHVVYGYAKLFYVYVGSMLVLGVLMASGIIFTAMSVNIVERRREIAMLRCGGMQFVTVARLITGENVAMTLVGVGLGLPSGVLTAEVFMRSYTNYQFNLPLVIKLAPLAVSGAAVLAAAAIASWPGLRAVRNLGLAAVVREHGR
jgi:putative ABC transport system permease protein